MTIETAVGEMISVVFRQHGGKGNSRPVVLRQRNMLLCDHIIFWHRHRSIPVIIPDSFDEEMFLLAVKFSVVQVTVIELLGKVMKDLANDLKKVFDEEGKSGVDRMLDRFRKAK